MAQRQRAGLITPRSLDRNGLSVLFVICFHFINNVFVTKSIYSFTPLYPSLPLFTPLPLYPFTPLPPLPRLPPLPLCIISPKN